MDEYGYCTTCGTDRVFEQPDCADGHGTDCPERCCACCGTAILVDPPRPAPRRLPGRSLAA